MSSNNSQNSDNVPLISSSFPDSTEFKLYPSLDSSTPNPQSPPTDLSSNTHSNPSAVPNATTQSQSDLLQMASSRHQQESADAMLAQQLLVSDNAQQTTFAQQCQFLAANPQLTAQILNALVTANSNNSRANNSNSIAAAPTSSVSAENSQMTYYPNDVAPTHAVIPINSSSGYYNSSNSNADALVAGESAGVPSQPSSVLSPSASAADRSNNSAPSFDPYSYGAPRRGQNNHAQRQQRIINGVLARPPPSAYRAPEDPNSANRVFPTIASLPAEPAARSASPSASASAPPAESLQSNPVPLPPRSSVSVSVSAPSISSSSASMNDSLLFAGRRTLSHLESSSPVLPSSMNPCPLWSNSWNFYTRKFCTFFFLGAIAIFCAGVLGAIIMSVAGRILAEIWKQHSDDDNSSFYENSYFYFSGFDYHYYFPFYVRSYPYYLSSSASWFVVTLSYFLYSFALLPVVIALSIAILKAIRRDSLEHLYADFFAFFCSCSCNTPTYFRFLPFSLLSCLFIFLVAFLTVFLFLPLIFFFVFTHILLYDYGDNTNAMYRAFKVSAKLAWRNKLRVGTWLIMVLIFDGIGIGMIIGTAFVFPLTLITYAMLYEELTGRTTNYIYNNYYDEEYADYDHSQNRHQNSQYEIVSVEERRRVPIIELEAADNNNNNNNQNNSNNNRNNNYNRNY